MHRRALFVTLVTTFVVGATAGCSGVQQSLECPGDDCPAALRAVADDAGGVPEVTAVDRAWRFYNIDKGASGGVDARAAVTGEGDARPIAREIADLYRASAVESVDHIYVHVVPHPELSRPDDGGSITSGGFSEGTDVPCAATRCSDEVAAFEAAFANDPISQDATLDGAGWADGAIWPETTLEVTAGDAVLDPAELDAFDARISDLADAAGLYAIGEVRTVIHYNEQVDYSFSFDGH